MEKKFRKLLDIERRENSFHKIVEIVGNDLLEKHGVSLNAPGFEGAIALFSAMKQAASLPGVTDADTICSAHEFWHLMRFVAAGRRVYSVSEGLAQKLLYTNTKGVPTEWLKLPFDSIYIKLPPSLLTIADQRTGDHPVEGIICTRNAEPKIHMLVIGAEKQPGDLGTAMFFYLSLSEPNVAAALDQIKAGLKDTIGKSSTTGFMREFVQQSGGEKKTIRSLYEDMSDIAQLVVNAILYMTSSDPDMLTVISPKDQLLKRLSGLGPKKRAKLAHRAEKTSALNETLLGSSIVIQRDPDAQQTQESTGLGGWRLTSRFMVEGHWKNQPYGPKSMLRKHIWIEPYYKGPQDATEVVRDHILK